MRLIELLEFQEQPITLADLKQLEMGLDILFSKLDIDVDITGKHFVDRINDPRNGKQVSIGELKDVFKKVFMQYGTKIKELDDLDQGVLVDLATQLNIPFVLRHDSRKDMDSIAAKTVMRKPNFHTPDTKFTVQ